MTPERIAELRPFRVAQEYANGGNLALIVNHPPKADDISEMLDEIERMQEEARWRDPKVEMPPAGTEAIVAIRWGDTTELAVIESCGEHGWSQSTDHRYIDENVVAWMPAPAFPEAEG